MLRHIALAALLLAASPALAWMMEMTNVTGIHLEKSARDWLIAVDSNSAGNFQGRLCIGSDEETQIAAATILRAERDNLPLDLVLYGDSNWICLKAVRISKASAAEATQGEK